MLALLLIAFAAAWRLLDGSRATLDGQRMLPGLEANVSISRDALGTVTLKGKRRDDISFAMGYVHAPERFVETGLMRRMSAGQLSALVGPAALEVDLHHRQHHVHTLDLLAHRFATVVLGA